jgi:hypothetical protein
MTYQIQFIKTAFAATTAIAFSLLCSGCGQTEGQPLAQVSGVVTIDGKPVKGALLEFIPQAPGGAVAYGQSDGTGRYTMHFGQKRTGAVIGRSLVRITSDDRVSVDGQDYERKELFPPKYNAKSEEYVDVKAGKNEFDFNCESGDFQPKQAAAENTGGT